jgi:hypothetical protein
VRLVSGGRGDEFERLLQVEFVVGEMRREVVQQVVIPRLALHRVGGMHDAAAHQAVPEAVDDGAGEPAVLRVRHQRGELLEALGLRRGGVDLPQLGEEPARRRGLAHGLVAAVNLHLARRVNRGQPVGFLQLPAVNETVVARRALEVDAEEALADGLRELNFRGRARAHVAAPADAGGEALALRRVGNQLARKLVVGLVLNERAVEPLGDLRAPAGDEAGAGVVVAEQVVPERQPVLGVSRVVREQVTHELRALVRRLVGEELRQRLRLGQQAHEVEVRATGESGVVHRLRRCGFALREVRIEDAVNRVRAARDDGRQRGTTRLERRFVSRLLEREALLPRRARINPLAQQLHLLGREARALGRHLLVGVFCGDGLDERGLGGVAGKDRLAALAAGEQRRAVVHAEAALLLVARVALAAVLAQDGDDLVGEVHLARRGGGKAQRGGEQRQNADGKQHGAKHGRTRTAGQGGFLKSKPAGARPAGSAK